MKWLILVCILVLIVFAIVGIILYFSLRKEEESNCFIFACPEGQRCASDGNCVDAETCTSNLQCPEGSECVNGLCTGVTPPPPPSGVTCSLAGDCPNFGERCLEQVCTSVCSSTEQCPEGTACINGKCETRSCLDSSGCPSGLACLPNKNGKNVCMGGIPCTDKCPAGLSCIDGVCKQCGSGQCPNRVCLEGVCFGCSRARPCPEGKVCMQQQSLCCPSDGAMRPCSDSADCTTSNPYCVKTSSPDIGYCSCAPLDTGSYCMDNQSCANGSCKRVNNMFKRCTIESCVFNSDCPSDKPYCKGVCDKNILGSRCTMGGPCDKQGYFCSNGICTENPPKFGEECVEKCAPGLVCKRREPGVYSYCEVAE